MRDEAGCCEILHSLTHLSSISHRVRAGNQVGRISGPPNLCRPSNGQQPLEKTHNAMPAPSLAVKCWSSYLNSQLNFFKPPPSLYGKRTEWLFTEQVRLDPD